jgi:hypothetical protein
MNKIRQGDSDANYNDQVAPNPSEDKQVKTLRWAFRVIFCLNINLNIFIKTSLVLTYWSRASQVNTCYFLLYTDMIRVYLVLDTIQAGEK